MPSSGCSPSRSSAKRAAANCARRYAIFRTQRAFSDLRACSEAADIERVDRRRRPAVERKLGQDSADRRRKLEAVARKAKRVIQARRRTARSQHGKLVWHVALEA